ncbi:MAG: ATP-binding protein [Spirochaetales bacterium]|nr:ATP-binding protein [Spirochaetales bacterium]
MARNVKKIVQLHIILFALSLSATLLASSYLITGRYRKSRLIGDFTNEMTLATNEFYYKVLFVKENINALSSRTMIRKSLYNLEKGKETLEEVSSYTQSKYSDGARVYTNLIYVARRDNLGRLIADYPPGNKEGFLFDNSKMAFFSTDEGCHLMIQNPIIHNGEIIGTDEGVFKVCHFEENSAKIIKNRKIVSEKIETLQFPGLALSLPVGDTGYFLYGEINEETVKEMRREILFITLLQSFLLIIIIILLSYFTLMKEIRKLMKDQQLTEKQLARQEKMSVISQITAGIAHEINNVLTGILGLSELTESLDGFPDEGRPYMKEINISGTRAALFIRKLTDYSRQSIHSVETIILKDRVNRIVASLKKDPSYPLSCKILIGNEKFDMNPNHLEQILSNLIENAREAMKMGGKTSLIMEKVKTTNHTYCPHCDQILEGEWIGISVKDEGCGIDEETGKKIFDPFFTTKNGKKGLGLSQISGILTHYEGHILFRNTPQGGTEMTILLPFTPRYSREQR